MQQAGHWLLTKIVAFSRKIWGCRKKKSCVFAPHETAPKDVVKEAISIHYMALWRVLLHKKWLDITLCVVLAFCCPQ